MKSNYFVTINELSDCIKSLNENNILKLLQLNISFDDIKNVEFIMDQSNSMLKIVDNLNNEYIFTPTILSEEFVKVLFKSMTLEERGKLIAFPRKKPTNSDLLNFIKMAMDVAHRKDNIPFDVDRYIYNNYIYLIKKLNDTLFELYSCLRNKCKTDIIGV